MFAIIQTGGKQYRIEKDSVIHVEKIIGEEGSKIELLDVLLIDINGDIQIGSPTLSGAKVEATIIKQMRDKKVIIFKKKRRQNYRRKNGHRQHLTVLKIDQIIV